MLDLSDLFFSDGDSRCFHAQLDLPEPERRTLAAARVTIREWLKLDIPKMLREAGYDGEPPTPRFYTQGSWAYRTLNAPAQVPQQADLDDGCYLPLSFVTQTKRPSVAAAVFFKAVDASLARLAKLQGWRLSHKPTCVRLELNPRAHVDVPLYAIPDAEFALLKANMEAYHGLDSAVFNAKRDRWQDLPRDKVLLAHREDDWTPSDPRAVKSWFEGAVKARGEQFRRITRFLKAYRDAHWLVGGPASILLMAAAEPHFQKHRGRDDMALHAVVAELPATLRKGVASPVDENEKPLTSRLGAEGVEDAARAFERLEKLLAGSLSASNKEQACIWMQQAFGSRFPNRPDMVRLVSVAASIASAPAVAGPSELVGRNKAG